MKNIILSLSVFFICIASTNAQEIGVRFGQTIGGNVAVDAIFSTGEFNRIHADVSFGDGLGVEALWDFLYKPIDNSEIKWYVGAGPFAYFGSDFQFGATGEVGLEYKFEGVPISASIDWRPHFRLVDNTDFEFSGFGLNIRYVF